MDGWMGCQGWIENVKVLPFGKEKKRVNYRDGRSGEGEVNLLQDRSDVVVYRLAPQHMDENSKRQMYAVTSNRAVAQSKRNATMSVHVRDPSGNKVNIPRKVSGPKGEKKEKRALIGKFCLVENGKSTVPS